LGETVEGETDVEGTPFLIYGIDRPQDSTKR
jgi:hypothetical protein